MSAASFPELLRMAAAIALMLAGAAAIGGGVLGVLRFPDAYARTHAASVVQALGAPLFALGLAILAHDGATALRLVVLGALLGAAAPVLAHATASAMHAAGLAPITGPYRAPRPGAAPRSDA